MVAERAERNGAQRETHRAIHDLVPLQVRSATEFDGANDHLLPVIGASIMQDRYAVLAQSDYGGDRLPMNPWLWGQSACAANSPSSALTLFKGSPPTPRYHAARDN
jgi:hypothetical protein